MASARSGGRKKTGRQTLAFRTAAFTLYVTAAHPAHLITAASKIPASVAHDRPLRPAVGAGLVGKFEFAYSYWDEHCDHLPPTHFCGGPNPDPELHTPTDRMSGGCNVDIADSPSYAFRNKSGTTMVLASMNRGSRGMLGPNLLEAKHVCHFYANSSNNPDETMFSSHEWIKGVYPFRENNTIYGLNDMEFHQPWNATLPNGKQISGEFKFISITLAVSTDGGQWFKHAAEPPDHVVATMQVQWNVTSPNFGYRMPSNILRGKRPEHQGFFYATFNTGVHDERFSSPHTCAKHPQKNCGALWTPNQPAEWESGVVGGQALGTCIMRTRDLSDPSSWRAWDGTFTLNKETGRREPSFTIDLSPSPYVAGNSGRTCAVLDNPKNTANRTSANPNHHNAVLWSTFYGRYMLFGNGGSTNWRFGLSDDLVRCHGHVAWRTSWVRSYLTRQS